jgi:hypothetical protein
MGSSITATNCKAYPIVYPSGPIPVWPVVNLTDPNITQPSYWKDSNDSTLFIMRELGCATYHDFLPNTNPLNLDTVWTDTFPAVSFPQSGCINIYQRMLHGRTLTTPSPTDPLRILWEPGYIPIRADTDTVWTAFKNDTIWVSGCTLSAKLDTDEWDDDILYHEFGHYQMYFFYEGFDPCQEDSNFYNKNHEWWLNDTSHKVTAWTEGWPNFVSGCARAGTGSDTFLINTDKKIGDSLGTRFYYYNLENPWDHSDSSAHPFEGGEYCEGAVTGILFDIYDSHNEYPYPYDSTRSDSFAKGFDSLFTIMRYYDPWPGAYTNIVELFWFYMGWNYFWYGDTSKLLQNFRHHGYFPPNIPAPPESLVVLQKAQNWGVISKWPSVSGQEYSNRTGIEKYCVYRLDPDASEFIRVTEDGITDTFYIDSDVEAGDSLRYYVTSIDSNGYESSPSDTIDWVVTHWVLVSDTDEASAHGKKIRRDNSGNIYIVYSAFDNIYHVSTTDKGSTWAGKPIGEGEYPSIDLDSNNKSNVVWMWYSPPMQIAQSILYFARDTGSAWTDPDTLWNYWANSGIPCFQIDDDDTGHVAWMDNNPANYEIYYKRSTNRGGGWESTQRLTTNAGESSYPSIASRGNYVHVVWQDYRSTNWEIWYKRSTNNGASDSWESDVRLTEMIYDSFRPSIAVAGNAVYAAWEDDSPNNWEIYFARSTNNGQTWESPKRLTYNSDEQRRPSISANGDGDTIIVVWEDIRDNDWEIYAKRSLDGGENWGSDTRLTESSGQSRYPNLWFVLHYAHVVWQDYRNNNWEIYYKKSTNSGEDWDESDTRLTEDNNYSEEPSITVTWQYSGKIDCKHYVHVVWNDGRNNNPEIYYDSDRYEFGMWPGPEGGGQLLPGSGGSKDYSVSPTISITPNPMINQGRIQYSMTRNSNINISIFNISGRIIKELFNGKQSAGARSILWNLKDDLGNTVPAGIYLCTMRTETGLICRKFLILK